MLDFSRTWILSKDLEKYSNINFHENFSSGRPVSPWGQTYGLTYMMNLAAILSLICKRDWCLYHHNTRNDTLADNSFQNWYPACLIREEICIAGKALLPYRHALLYLPTWKLNWLQFRSAEASCHWQRVQARVEAHYEAFENT